MVQGAARKQINIIFELYDRKCNRIEYAQYLNVLTPSDVDPASLKSFRREILYSP